AGDATIVWVSAGQDGSGGGVFAQRYVEAGRPPTVQSVQVNGGAQQRSRVSDLAVTFTAPVTFAGPLAAAFRLTRISTTGPPGDLSLSVDLSASTVNQSTARLTFSGDLTEFGSLVDGTYRLTVLSSQVSGAGGALDGDVNGTPGGDFTFDLYRLFGDA